VSGMLMQAGFAEELQTNSPAMSSIAPAAGPPSQFTITFASAHGLQAQDSITISGATPSTYNGTWTVFSAPTSTTVVVMTLTTLAANTVVGTYVAGIYGRGGTATRFLDAVSEGVKLMPGRIESNGQRAGNKVARGDKWTPNRTGAQGPLVLEVQSKGFGLIWKHLMGQIAVAGPTDSAYTMTATIGAMLGKSLVTQFGRAATPSQMIYPWTYPGTKFTAWKVSWDLDGNLMLELTLDCYDEVYTVVLAVASYPANSEIFTYAGALFTIAGVPVDVKHWELSCDMGYAADRRAGRGSTLGREPVEAKSRSYSWAATAEFTDMVSYNRTASSTRAGAMAAWSMQFVAPTLIGAATYPSLMFSAPQARFDGDTPVNAGPDLLELPLNGILMNTPSGTNDALSIVYVTADSTP
jgi:hypothetical protein